MEYSHRDRRAQRDVTRAFWTLLGLALGCIAVALFVPLPFAGFAGVAGLLVLGAAYLRWAERMLSTYSNDLRLARTGETANRFLRAELATPLGLDRDVGRPTERSPHSRRRYTARRESVDEPLPGASGDPPHA